MPSLSDLPITVVVGGKLDDIETRPLPTFSDQACEFLGSLSRHLLAIPQHREYPDLAAFAYWCRPAHLRRLAQQQPRDVCRLGRGLALHIAPANVPVNFAFSLAFGMLSGNANIVRLPQKAHPQTEILCQALRQLLAETGRERLAAMNRVIRYPRNDGVTRRLCSLCQARVLWGGDETIAHIRQMPVPARSVEVAFADRYSMCLLDAVSVCDATPTEMSQLVAGFYNDVYPLDQQACSSPHLVVWRGTEDVAKVAMDRFWSALADHVSRRYDLQGVHAVDKYTQLCHLAVEMPDAVHAVRHGNQIYRVRLKQLPKDTSHLRGRFGLFFEYVTMDIGELRTIVNDKYQTLTCHGVERPEVAQWVVSSGLSGIDRIVPVGNALDIDIVWVGHDLISHLSRIVSLS